MTKTTLSKATIERIRNSYTPVVIGKYTYKVNGYGDILRCKTDDIGREWIDNEGRHYSAWEVVAHL